jgi:hypothetical protein
VQLDQAIPTTVGTQYRLVFDIGTDPQYDTAPVGVEVTAGSDSELFISTPQNYNQWETFQFDFVATSATTSLSLIGNAGTNQKYVGLDNVVLMSIPEPGTLSLVAIPAVLFLASWRRWRKR